MLADRARVQRLNTAEDANGILASARPPSARELQVLSLAAAGRSNGEIAATLQISDRTVESQIRRMADRYAVDSRVGLVRYAVRAGWIDLKGE
jgi:DNA-binding NarL/FixJ family response regulator